MRAFSVVKAMRAAVASALALSVLACADSRTAPANAGVQLMISLGSQVTASRRVDIVVNYETSGGGTVTLMSSLNLVVAGGTQQLPVSVDLKSCLTDANHVGGSSTCRLRVTVTLKDGSSGLVLDVATLGPIDATPGSTQAPAAITVAAVNTVTISGLVGTYTVGQTAQAGASVRDAAGNVLTRPVTWSSSAGTVATVNGNGLVTAVGPGTASISAASGGVTVTTSITVIAAVASVSVSPTSTSIFTGETVQFTATPRDAAGGALTGRVVTWSSNSGSATVSSTGLVTGVSAGSATITATSEGRTGTATVTVSVPPPPPPAVFVTLSPTSMSANHTVGGTSCPQIIGNVTVTNTHTAAVTWLAGSDHSALSVSGVVAPGGTLSPGGSSSFSVRFTCSQTQSFTGTVTVTATSGGVTQTRTVSVTMTISP
jgi:uncharacterized protein YjdB